jgi:hypothetical protein
VDPEEGARAVDEFAQKSGVKEAVANNAANILFRKYKDRVKLESLKM